MSTSGDPALFSPTMIGTIKVANRIAMAPLTRSRAGMDGVHSALAVDYYRQCASAGLIVTETMNISRQGRGYAFTPGIYTDAHVRAWRRVTEAVHGAGGKILCQLWHVGRMLHVDLQENGAAPVAPSAIQAGELIFFETQTQARPCHARSAPHGRPPRLAICLLQDDDDPHESGGSRRSGRNHARHGHAGTPRTGGAEGPFCAAAWGAGDYHQRNAAGVCGQQAAIRGGLSDCGRSDQAGEKGRNRGRAIRGLYARCICCPLISDT
jgi:hypothetical protein